MILRLLNKMSLTMKVALIATIAIVVVAGTLAALHGASSRSNIRQMVEAQGLVQGKMLSGALYGATRFDDAASAEALLQATLDASNGEGLAALILKTDGQVFASAAGPAAMSRP